MNQNHRSGFGWENHSVDEITALLKKTATIAVVGLSAKPDRPSFAVAGYLQKAGYKIIPVNPREEEILGEKSYPSLKEIPETIDLVNVFRKSSEVANIVDDAIKIGAQAVWLQEDIISVDDFKKGEAAGIFMVMDRCILKEHRRLVAV